MSRVAVAHAKEAGVIINVLKARKDGPTANLPRWGGCILASNDPVATDVAIARLMTRDWTKQFAIEAEQRGLGGREPIDFLGVPLESVAFEAWRGHQDLDYLPINFLVGEGVTS